MDLLRLAQPSYLPDKLIEGWSALNWAERYLPAGDFELRSPWIEDTRAALPVDSLVTLRDSKEVMIVETHDIDRDEETGAPEVIIRGRTVESFAEQRITIGKSAMPFNLQQQYPTPGAVAVMLHEALVNATGTSNLMSTADATANPSKGARGYSYENAVPNLRAAVANIANDSLKTWTLDAPGDFYKTILEWASSFQLGIRTVRPPSNPYGIVTVSSTGVLSANSATNTPYLLLEVYKGIDRSRSTVVGGVTPVIFSYPQGHIDNPKQIYSKKLYKNIAYATSAAGNGDVYQDGGNLGDGLYIGFARRVLMIDVGTQYGTQLGTVSSIMDRRGKAEIIKLRDRSFYTGDVNGTTPYEYGVDYFLGDKVSLVSGSGPEEIMYVGEYVRSEDSLGERGSPTLVASLVTT